MKPLLALVFSLALAAAAHAQTVTTPSSICTWCDLPITWSGHPAPSSSNRLVMTAPGAASAVNWSNGSVIAWRNTNSAASGTLPLIVPGSTPFGNYVIRLTGNDGTTILATSAPFEARPFVNGQVFSGSSPLAGVVVTGTNGAACGTTDASGWWGCVIPVGWSGTITPTKAGNLFSPASRSYTNVTNIITGVNFATATSHAVSGTITRDGVALSGAAVAGSNGASCTSTNASGQYTCAVLPGWSGTVTPSFAGHLFTPASRSYTNVTAAQSAQGYVAQAAFQQVSGSVTLNGLPLTNVAMTATGGPTCSTTNSAGQYSCTVPLNWSGSVTPSATGYSFGPANRSYTNVTAAQSAQSFTATLATATAPLYFVHVDHLNTPRLVANDQQQAVWRWDQQEPFGLIVPDENPSSLGAFEFPLRFPGQYADKETNLDYNFFRDYDPAIGRYVQSDPIGLRGGLNTFAYAGGDPLSSADPEGLFVSPPPIVPPPLAAAFGVGSLIGTGIYWIFDNQIQAMLPDPTPAATVAVLTIGTVSQVVPGSQLGQPSANDPCDDDDYCKRRQIQLKYQFQWISQQKSVAVPEMKRIYNRKAMIHNNTCRKFPVEFFDPPRTM